MPFRKFNRSEITRKDTRWDLKLEKSIRIYQEQLVQPN